LTISDTANAEAGNYWIDIVGIAPTSTHTTTVGLSLYTAVPDLPTLLTPPDGATDQALVPAFTWNPAAFSLSYNFELDETPFFDSPVVTATGLTLPEFSVTDPLAGGSCYWWHVQSENVCGAGEWTEPYHFATVALGVSFYDDLEAGGDNWTHAAGQGSDQWVLSTAQSHSPTHSWFHPDPGTVHDVRLWNVNPLVVGAGSTLSFWHRHQFEASYDGAVLEISTDGGGTWSDLGDSIIVNGYDGTISTCCSNPLGGREAWVSDLTTWTKVEVDLSDYAGESVHIRWRFGSDSSISDEGWYIDDVEITAPLPANPAPTLLSITPDSGTTWEPTPVVITGGYFTGTTNLQLGETWLMSVTLVNTSTIEAVVPAGMPTGVYTLTLYNGDCQMATLPEAFTVTAADAPIEGLTAANDSPTELGSQTTLSATVAAGSNVSYEWDFGDNTGGIGDVVTHTYPAVGVYQGVVTATNNTSVVTATTVVTITDVAIAGLAATNDSPTTLGDTTTLTATIAAGSNVTYAWDFDDGSTGSGEVVTHVFAQAGTYTVSVTASNSAGSLTTTTVVTVIAPEPEDKFIYLPLIKR
jgi:PKD repeat protein